MASPRGSRARCAAHATEAADGARELGAAVGGVGRRDLCARIVGVEGAGLVVLAHDGVVAAAEALGHVVLVVGVACGEVLRQDLALRVGVQVARGEAPDDHLLLEPLASVVEVLAAAPHVHSAGCLLLGGGVGGARRS